MLREGMKSAGWPDQVIGVRTAVGGREMRITDPPDVEPMATQSLGANAQPKAVSASREPASVNSIRSGFGSPCWRSGLAAQAVHRVPVGRIGSAGVGMALPSVGAASISHSTSFPVSAATVPAKSHLDVPARIRAVPGRACHKPSSSPRQFCRQRPQPLVLVDLRPRLRLRPARFTRTHPALDAQWRGLVSPGGGW